jgi:hypothetical protein
MTWSGQLSTSDTAGGKRYRVAYGAFSNPRTGRTGVFQLFINVGKVIGEYNTAKILPRTRPTRPNERLDRGSALKGSTKEGATV